MPIIPFNGVMPEIDSSVFIAPGAWLTGDVRIGARSSVFFHAVLRGDILPIRVGSGTNIQDHAMVHTSHGMSETIIGDNVTVGHRAIVHGATIGDLCIVGMGATILDNAIIEPECIIGAHSLVVKGSRIPTRSLVMGTPAKVVRELTEDELKSLVASAEGYQRTAAVYVAEFNRGS